MRPFLELLGVYCLMLYILGCLLLFVVRIAHDYRTSVSKMSQTHKAVAPKK